MPKTRDIARLHHQTVAEYHNHIVRPARVRDGVKHKMTILRVDMRVWKTALELAQGDQTRIVVRSATEVVVLNQPKRAVPR